MNTPKRAVLKFGGSVLTSQDDFPRITNEIRGLVNEGFEVVAVVSAYFGITESLIAKARSQGLRPNSTEYAELIAKGEFESAYDLNKHLIKDGLNASWKAPSEFSFTAMGKRDSSRPTSINTNSVEAALSKTPIVVMPGFSAVDPDQSCVLLGRGGSDISAVYLAHALKLDSVRLLKDVNGLYDMDPNIYAHARRLSYIDYSEAQRIGGELIQTEAIDFAASKNICIDIAAIGESFASRIGPALKPVVLSAVAQ